VDLIEGTGKTPRIENENSGKNQVETKPHILRLVGVATTELVLRMGDRKRGTACNGAEGKADETKKNDQYSSTDAKKGTFKENPDSKGTYA